MISCSIFGNYRPGEFILQCPIFLPFHAFHGALKQEYWSGLPFPSPVEHVLSELSTMTHPSWVALHGMACSFIELDKAVVHVITWYKTIYRYKTIHIAFSPRLCFKSVFFFFPKNVFISPIFSHLRTWSCSVFFYYPFDFCEVMVMHQLSFMASVICVTLFHLDHSD